MTRNARINFLTIILLFTLSIAGACSKEPEFDPESLSYADELALPDGFDNLSLEEGAKKLFRTDLEMKDGQKSGLVQFKVYNKGDKISPGIIYISKEDYNKAKVPLASNINYDGQGIYLIKQNDEWKVLKLPIIHYNESSSSPKDKAIINVDGTIAMMPFTIQGIIIFIPVK